MEDDQIEYNTDFPLGEGNFGIVYKGVLTKSDGDWEQVRTLHLRKELCTIGAEMGIVDFFHFVRSSFIRERPISFVHRSFVNDLFRSVFFNRSEKKPFFSKSF